MGRFTRPFGSSRSQPFRGWNGSGRSLDGYAEALDEEERSALETEINAMLVRYDERRAERLADLYQANRRQGTLLDERAESFVLSAAGPGRLGAQRTVRRVADTVVDPVDSARTVSPCRGT